MGITASCNVRDVVPWMENVGAKARNATRMAGTSALRAMRAESSRRIREKKAIKPGHIDTALALIYPSNKDLFVWRLVAKAKPLPLIAFGARQTTSGVSVEVTKGKRATVAHAFLATMASGHKGVFMRRGPKRIATKGGHMGKRRQPIFEAFTASVAPTLGRVAPEVLERGKDVFRATFTRLVKVPR